MSGSDPLCHLRACIGLGKDGDESGRLDRADAGVLKICLPSFKQGYETQSSYFLSCSPKFSHYGVPRFGIWSRVGRTVQKGLWSKRPIHSHLTCDLPLPIIHTSRIHFRLPSTRYLFSAHPRYERERSVPQMTQPHRLQCSFMGIRI